MRERLEARVLTSGFFFRGWWIVAVSMIGISSGTHPFVFASLGLFIKHFNAEFGWTRAQVSACITVLMVAIAISLPLVGRIIDRYGARAVLLPSTLVLGLCLSAIPGLVTELWHLGVIFLLLGTLGVGTNSVTYMPVFAAWFDKRRGLAIGIGMAGTGLGLIYVPVLVQTMIDAYGWRAGYYALSAIVLCLVLPLLFIAIRDTPAELGLQPDGASSDATPKSASKDVGLELSEVLRTAVFWKLVALFLVISFVLNGMLPHVVPMLTDRGMSAAAAALAASAVGVGVFGGRILIGYLVDHFFAPYVAIFFFTLSAIGVGILAFGTVGPIALVAALMIGLSIGAENDFLAYLASRYFGLRAYGVVCGLLLASVLCGTAFAPIAYATWFETYGSYVGILRLGVGATFVAVAIIALLGPYPDWDEA